MTTLVTKGNTQNGTYAESRDLYITTKRFSTAQFFCSILLLLHFIRTQITYFKGHNIGAKCVQIKAEALIILKKVQSLRRGQDGNSAQDAFTSWALKLNSS